MNIHKLMTFATGVFLLLLLTDFSCSLTNAECPVINFFEAIHDKVLQGHIIKIVNVTEEANCQVQCVLTKSCVSYNLGPKTNSNQHICELSKFDHIRFPDDLKVKEGFTYGAVKNPCSQGHCPRNSTCKPNYISDGYRCVCPKGFQGMNCHLPLVRDCLSAKLLDKYAADGVYMIDPNGGSDVDSFPAYCDMTTAGGGWTMCYTTDDRVNPRTETTYEPADPYGSNGYRTNCNTIRFQEILFVDEQSQKKAYFTRKINSPMVVADTYGRSSSSQGLFTAHGVASPSHEYQLLLCDTPFYSGVFVSAYTKACWKRCKQWCGDLSSPFFRTAGTQSGYTGVAFNINGHRPHGNKPMSVGLR